MQVSLSLAHLRTCYVSLLLDTVTFRKQRSNWFLHLSVSCKLSFASGLFSYERGSLGWIHYYKLSLKLSKEFIFSRYWDYWPHGILRLVPVYHLSNTPLALKVGASLSGLFYLREA